jgi:hypothetical protein
MKSWKQVRFILSLALLATLGGTSFAAATAPPAALPAGAIFSAADTPSQSQETPVDCKKKPDDPRCKDKPY